MYSHLDIFSRVQDRTGGSDGCVMDGSMRCGVSRAGVVVGDGVT